MNLIANTPLEGTNIKVFIGGQRQPMLQSGNRFPREIRGHHY